MSDDAGRSLVGRAGELQELRRALAEHRLVTLVGAGGIGKTRLAAAVAGSGPWVELGGLAGPELVYAALTETLGVRSTDLGELLGALSAHPVLVLDTCEHVLPVVAGLVDTLLEHSDRLTVLATSQLPLRRPAERLVRIGPLPYERPDDDAVTLFFARAQAAGASLPSDPDARTEVATLCGRLGGNPLAIELAAARCAVLSVPELIAGLDDATHLLAGGSPGPARHRTLQATLGWTYALLDPAARRLLRLLAFFPGGATLTALAHATAQLPVALLDPVAALADASLLGTVQGAAGTRYVLGELVRQYALKRALQHDADAGVPARVLGWLQTAAAPGGDLQWPADLPTVRSTLAWAVGADPAGALELAVLLAPRAIRHGHYAEARDWLARAADADVPPALRAAGLLHAGTLAFLQCDYPAATRQLRAAEELLTAQHDDAGLAEALRALGGVARERGDYPRALELLRRSAALSDAVGDELGAAAVRIRQALTALFGGDQTLVRPLVEPALRVGRRRDDPKLTAEALNVLGAAVMMQGDLGAARSYFDQAAEIAAVAGLAEAAAYADQGRGLIALIRHDSATAGPAIAAALARHHEIGDWWRTAAVLLDVASWARFEQRPALAARMLGASEELLADLGATLPPAETDQRQSNVAMVSGALDPEELAAAWTAGRVAPLSAVVAEALAVLAEPRPAASPGPADVPARRPPPGSPEPLHVHTLGRELVSRGGRPLGAADFGYAKPRELLFLLAVGGPADKASIGLALWPDAAPGELRNAFHTTLHALRGAVGTERVRYRGGRYALVTEGLSVDAVIFERELDAAAAADVPEEELRHLRQATAAYGGDLLPVSAPDWSDPVRERLRRRYQRALLALGRRLVGRRHFPAAADALSTLIASDPLGEAAYRELMRCHAAAGEPARALHQYELLADRLADELAAVPAAVTTQLRDAIRAGRPV